MTREFTLNLQQIKLFKIMADTITAQKVRVYRMSTPQHECPWGLKAINLLEEKMK